MIYRYADLGEAVEALLDQEMIYHFEGERGVRQLETLVEALDIEYQDFNYFLADNPGAQQAIVDWICDQNLSHWRTNVEAMIEDAELGNEALR